MNVPSFEKACEILGIDPNLLPGVEGLPEVIAKRQIAAYKLEIIQNATNGYWKPDFGDDTWKYTPWFEWVPSLSAFVYTRTDYSHTYTFLGARFYFENRETARYFGEQHIDLINDLHRVA